MLDEYSNYVVAVADMYQHREASLRRLVVAMQRGPCLQLPAVGQHCRKPFTWVIPAHQLASICYKVDKCGKQRRDDQPSQRHGRWMFLYRVTLYLTSP
jgi:hypothetical protein